MFVTRSSEPSKLQRHLRVVQSTTAADYDPGPPEDEEKDWDPAADMEDCPEDSGEPGSLMCDLCGFEAPAKKVLRQHIEAEHEGVRYECRQCVYVAKSRGTLRRHEQSAHEGVKYPCDQCTYMATAPNALKRHIQSIHEQVKHPCDQCEHRATTPASLKLHIKVYKLI